MFYFAGLDCNNGIKPMFSCGVVISVHKNPRRLGELFVMSRKIMSAVCRSISDCNPLNKIIVNCVQSKQRGINICMA